MPNTPLIAPRVPLTDPRTGLISREWYRFLMDQATLTGGSALTKTNDSNVTLTLGGSPGAALLAPVSLTLGWTGLLPITRGGTGAGTATGAREALGAAASDHNHAGVYEPVLGFTPLDKAGDTMGGPLVLSGAPTLDLHAVSKVYVDEGDAAAEAAANAYTDDAVAAFSAISFNADDLVTVPDGSTFALVFTDAGNVVAIG